MTSPPLPPLPPTQETTETSTLRTPWIPTQRRSPAGVSTRSSRRIRLAAAEGAGVGTSTRHPGPAPRSPAPRSTAVGTRGSEVAAATRIPTVRPGGSGGGAGLPTFGSCLCSSLGAGLLVTTPTTNLSHPNHTGGNRPADHSGGDHGSSGSGTVASIVSPIVSVLVLGLLGAGVSYFRSSGRGGRCLRGRETSEPV